MPKESTKTPDAPIMVTAAELAYVLGLDLDTVNNWVRREIIARSRIGGRLLRNRLFSEDEVSKAALIAELVRLGIGPSPASEAVAALWGEWEGLEAPSGVKVYGVLAPTEGGWSVGLCWQKRTGGGLIQAGQSEGEKGFDLPTHAFTMVPISEMLASLNERLTRLLSEE